MGPEKNVGDHMAQSISSYIYLKKRKAKVKELIKPLFEQNHSNFYGFGPDEIGARIVKNPEIFRQALDIVEGK